jgi:hypothetical protein
MRLELKRVIFCKFTVHARIDAIIYCRHFMFGQRALTKHSNTIGLPTRPTVVTACHHHHRSRCLSSVCPMYDDRPSVTSSDVCGRRTPPNPFTVFSFLPFSYHSPFAGNFVFSSPAAEVFGRLCFFLCLYSPAWIDAAAAVRRDHGGAWVSLL